MTDSKSKPVIVRSATVGSSLRVFCSRQLEWMSEAFNVVAVSDDDEDLRALGENGIRISPVRMKRRISPFADLMSVIRMYRTLRRIRPRIVHSITPKAGLVSMLAARLAGVPVRIHTFTGLVWPTEKGFRRKLLKFTDRLLCLCATDIIAEGEGVRKALLELPCDRAVVLGHGSIRGVDLERFHKKKEANAGTRFIYVGRLVADKGLETLVKAFVRLNGSYPQTTLTIVGEEEQGIDPLPEETLYTLYNNKAIMPVGMQSDVDSWLRKADCLILPSRREGFPNVLLEASATGIPSISTDVNGAREILKSEHGDGGIIVPVDDVESLLEAMERIVSDTALGTTLGNNANRIAAERFNEITVYQNLMDFYNQKL